MIQLNQNKKILVLLLILVVMLIIFALLLKQKNDSDAKKDLVNSGQIVEREMTETEKITVVGIDPAQEAEVLNDSDGLYIYRIK